MYIIKQRRLYTFLIESEFVKENKGVMEKKFLTFLSSRIDIVVKRSRNFSLQIDIKFLKSNNLLLDKVISTNLHKLVL